MESLDHLKELYLCSKSTSEVIETLTDSKYERTRKNRTHSQKIKFEFWKYCSCYSVAISLFRNKNIRNVKECWRYPSQESSDSLSQGEGRGSGDKWMGWWLIGEVKATKLRDVLKMEEKREDHIMSGFLQRFPAFVIGWMIMQFTDSENRGRLCDKEEDWWSIREILISILDRLACRDF
jgi:hypothetical protein